MLNAFADNARNRECLALIEATVVRNVTPHAHQELVRAGIAQLQHLSQEGSV